MRKIGKKLGKSRTRKINETRKIKRNLRKSIKTMRIKTLEENKEKLGNQRKL